MILRYYAGLDPGGATGTPAIFAAKSGISGNATYQQETENITGAAGAIVMIQVTQYTVSNTMGEVLVNSGQVFLNSTFSITLSGGGTGSFVAQAQGDPSQIGSIVRATFTIVSVSIGQIGNPSSIQISKAF